MPQFQSVGINKPVKRFTNRDFLNVKLVQVTAIDFYKTYGKLLLKLTRYDNYLYMLCYCNKNGL